MKKTYIKPETLEILLQMQSLLETASQGGVTTGSSLGKGYDSGATTYSRRGGSSWDDEEE